MFKQYNTAGCKIQVRDLLRKRLYLKDSIRRHKKLIDYHKDKIDLITKETLIDVEKQLNFYLTKAENTLA